MCGNARITLPKAQQAQQQARWGDEIKSPAPAKVSADQSADDIAECAANRNGGAKNRHDSTSCFDREKIGQDRRRRWPIAAFTNSNAYASRKEDRERRRETGSAAGQAP